MARQLKSLGAAAIGRPVRCLELWQLSLASGRSRECSPKAFGIRQLNGFGRSLSGNRGWVLRCGCSQISKLARRRTQLKICRSPAIEKRLSPANPKARQCECSSRKVAVSCKRSVAAKLVPTINCSRPCGIRRYRATIGFRAACRLNSTLSVQWQLRYTLGTKVISMRHL